MQDTDTQVKKENGTQNIVTFKYVLFAMIFTFKNGVEFMLGFITAPNPGSIVMESLDSKILSCSFGQTL